MTPASLRTGDAAPDTRTAEELAACVKIYALNASIAPKGMAALNELARRAASAVPETPAAVTPEEFTGHTRGPWTIDDCGSPHGRKLGIRAHTGDHVAGYVAFVSTNWPHGAQVVQQETNARLIAAAPSLLAEVLTLRAQRDKLDADLKSYGIVAGIAGLGAFIQGVEDEHARSAVPSQDTETRNG